MSYRKIKVGDRVRIIKGSLVNPDYIGRICTVSSITDGGYVKFSDCDSVWTPDVLEFIETEEEVTPIDKRTAFLTRLGALFLSADAVGNYCGDDIESVTLIIGIGDRCLINYNIADPNVIINAGNIMDYEDN